MPVSSLQWTASVAAAAAQDTCQERAVSRIRLEGNSLKVSFCFFSPALKISLKKYYFKVVVINCRSIFPSLLAAPSYRRQPPLTGKETQKEP